MSIYTVNGSPVKYDNKWLAPGGTHDLPPYNSTDAGKALVVNNEGDDVEWHEVGSPITVDQHYDYTSTNPQSGTAVAEAISGVSQVPSSDQYDSGKVLTVNSSGNAEWITPSGGGGGSVTPYPAVGTDTLRFEFVDPSIDPSSLNTTKVSWTHRTEDPNRNVWDATMLANVYAAELFKNVLTLSYKCRLIDGKVYSVNNYSIESMFEGCRGLLSIDLTFTCDYGIGNTHATFHNCVYLEWIHISLDTGSCNIVNSNFMCEGCQALREIVWGYDVTSDPSYVYLTSYYDSIGNHSEAFQNCVRLKRIVGMYFASDSHHVLNMSAMFDGCRDLEQVPTLISISGGQTIDSTAIYTSDAFVAFHGCSSLKTIPPMVISHTSSAISDFGMCDSCTSLVTVPLVVFTNPISVDRMFADCISLKSVEIQGSENFNNTTRMFRRCTSLTKLPVLSVASGCDCTSMYQDIPYANDNLTAAYNALSTSGATTYTDAFTDCGTLTTAGTAQRASIPASWGGDGT